MKKEATEAGQKCWLGPCRRHLYFQAPLPALDGIISPRCLGSHPVRRTRVNPGAVSGEAAIRPLIAKAVQLMGKPPETTYFSHEWRRVATWGFANGAQTTRVDSLAIAAGGLRAKGRLSFKTGVFGAIEPPKAARRALWDKNKNSKP
jgi:hypothetical protein